VGSPDKMPDPRADPAELVSRPRCSEPGASIATGARGICSGATPHRLRAWAITAGACRRVVSLTTGKPSGSRPLPGLQRAERYCDDPQTGAVDQVVPENSGLNRQQGRQ